MDNPTVYGFDGERDWAYAKAKYGVEFRRANVAPGQRVYRLVRLIEKTGNASLVTKVTDDTGGPRANTDVAFYWPGAPDPPEPETAVSANDWYRNFIHGKTGGNGDVGPGMGKGAYQGIGQGGPHAVWIRDPYIPSDICEKLGMLAGTFHDHMDQIFELRVEPTTTPAPTPPEGVDHIFKVVSRGFSLEDSNAIVINVSGVRNLYDTRWSMGVVGSEWEIGPEHPTSLAKIVADTNYIPGDQEQERIFWLVIEEAGTGKILSEDIVAGYQTGATGVWTIEVQWLAVGGNGEEEPPSTPEGIAPLFAEMAILWSSISQQATSMAAKCTSLAEKFA